MNNNDVAKVYAALLSSPGMNDKVKIDLRIDRRVVLLLNQVIERGLKTKGEEGSYSIVDALSPEELKGLRDLGMDCLEKAGLTELYSKLAALGGK